LSRGDLSIRLTSPSGVESKLVHRMAESGQNFNSWKLTSVKYWGESAAGAWTINVADERTSTV
jgi:subtilisin-like proprotein convertase family protein